jgi:hypothetical protein
VDLLKQAVSSVDVLSVGECHYILGEEGQGEFDGSDSDEAQLT